MARSSRGDTYEAVIGLALKQFLPEEAKRKHIAAARAMLKEFQSRQKEPLPYTILCDGAESSSEEAVKPFGVIKYVFLRMDAVVKYALATARDLSPVDSGRYKKSWIVMVDKREMDVESNVGTISMVLNRAEEIIVVNFQPYARKIHLRGAKFRGVPPGIVEKLRQMTRRRFGQMITTEVKYITLGDGYILKRNYVQTLASGRRRLRSQAGEQLTYPALVIRPKYG